MKRIGLVFGIVLLLGVTSVATAGTVTYTVAKDSRMSAGWQQNLNNGTEQQMSIFSAGNQGRLVFGWDINWGTDVLPTIDSAEVRFWDRTYLGTAQPYIINRLTKDWLEMEVTWNSAKTGDAWTTPGGDYTATGETTFNDMAGNGSWSDWEDVKAIVQYWQANQSQNYGLLLRQDASATQDHTVVSREYVNWDGAVFPAELRITSSAGGEPPIPEPATLLLVGTGALGLLGYIRRRMLK